jgi:hypothetical protein
MTSAEAAHSAKDGAAHRHPPADPWEGVSGRADSLHEERREVFDSVLQAMRIQEPDAGRMAACAYLLGHLARTEQWCGCPERSKSTPPLPPLSGAGPGRVGIS